jgi:predicted CoA-binding protein
VTPNPDDATLRETLCRARTIAVVGASDRRERASHEVAAYLQRAGYRIIPVNPKLAGESILGERAVSSLADIREPVDIVEVFRRSEAVPEIIAQALKLSEPVIWLQLGVVHEESARIAREAGRTVVQDRCMKIEHARLCR